MQEKNIILMIDDEPVNLSVLGNILEAYGYELMAATNGRSGLELAVSFRPSLILLDVNMPGGWNGYKTCQEIKKNKITADIPILFLSAQNHQDNINEGFKSGGIDYISKPFNREELIHRIQTHIELHQLRHSLEQQVIEKTRKLSQTHVELEESYSESLLLLSVAGEYRDTETGMHTYRIGQYSELIGQLKGWDTQSCNNIKRAAPLHDIGKIAIPDKILLKEGTFDEHEKTKMSLHTIYGNEILLRHHTSNSPHIELAAEIALCHHERWDGSGYPRNLIGDQIPISARITSLVDCYDALRSNRPYKEPMSHEQSKNIILNGDQRTKPEHFDPELLSIFDKFHNQFENIYENNIE